MSLFEGLLAEADRVVDTVYAETFAFTPMREIVNGRPVPDEGRDAIAELEAVFDDQGTLLGVGDAGNPDRASSGPMISVIDDYLPQGVRRQDRFTRAKTGKVYEVTAVDPDGLGRTVLTVVEVAV